MGSRISCFSYSTGKLVKAHLCLFNISTLIGSLYLDFIRIGGAAKDKHKEEGVACHYHGNINIALLPYFCGLSVICMLGAERESC